MSVGKVVNGRCGRRNRTPGIDERAKGFDAGSTALDDARDFNDPVRLRVHTRRLDVDHGEGRLPKAFAFTYHGPIV